MSDPRFGRAGEIKTQLFMSGLLSKMLLLLSILKACLVLYRKINIVRNLGFGEMHMFENVVRMGRVFENLGKNGDASNAFILYILGMASISSRRHEMKFVESSKL